MRVEDYKAYMERVKTTAEMDERVLNNLQNSVANEGLSNKNYLQRTIRHTRTFLYRASIVAVCLLVILVIGKFSARVHAPGGSSNSTQNETSDSAGSAQKEDTGSSDANAAKKLTLNTPHLTDYYDNIDDSMIEGKISDYIIDCDYKHENEQVRFCIEEAISDGCITEILGYYEAKNQSGKEWIKQRSANSLYNPFSLNLMPAKSSLKNETALSNTYATGGYQGQERYQYEYREDGKLYFDWYCMCPPEYTGTEFEVSYLLYKSYNNAIISIPKQMDAPSYALQSSQLTKGKHYQPKNIVLSPLGGLMIRGKDLGIEPASDKDADNLTTWRLKTNISNAEPGYEETPEYPNYTDYSYTLVENGVWKYHYGDDTIFDADVWIGANILNKKQKKELDMEYTLFACRVPSNINLNKITTIQVDNQYCYTNQGLSQINNKNQ